MSSRYKRDLIKAWNEVAPRYHEKWAGPRAGPFQSTSELEDIVDIRPDSRLLDIGCGTGAAINLLSRGIGDSGVAIGVDTSISAIRMAKSNGTADFVIADAENLCLAGEFDVVTCQFALFFFPDAVRVLKSVRELMRDGGTLAVTVHGAGDSTPYHRIILDEILRDIPDYLAAGAPQMDRFGTRESLDKVVTEAGFGGVLIRERTFRYSPGTADSYWDGYLKYVAESARKRLDALPVDNLEGIRRRVIEKARRFERDGQIVFPWSVLILTARKQ